MKTYTLEEVKAILYDFADSEEFRFVIDGYYGNCGEDVAKEWIQKNLDENE